MEIYTYIISGLLLLMVSSTLAAVLVRSLLASAGCLALAATALSALLFLMGMQLAAVIELAVCAGLVTAIFISAISLMKPDPQAGLAKEKELARAAAELKLRTRRYLPLPVILLVLAACIWLFLPLAGPGSLAGLFGSTAPDGTVSASMLFIGPSETTTMLWEYRAVDIIGLALLIITGVLAVAAMIDEREEK